MRILVVDDNESITELVKTALTEQRYTVDIATDGQAGWQLTEDVTYDLILLDVMLPKLDGISFCQRLRNQGSQVPVLLLTAKDASSDKVAGLDAGADDYIVKPLDLQELSARIRALLRRGHGAASPVLEWGELRLNPKSCEVVYGSYPLHLTPKEYALLELFLRHNQRVFSRSAILDQLWTFDDEPPGEDTVKTHIKGLRQKLKAVGAADLVETVYGLGYRLNQAYLKPRITGSKSLEKQHEQTRTAIAKIWERAKGKILQRIQILEQVSEALSTGSLSPDSPNQENWQEAWQEAHKLAGALGTFGIPTGTHIARQIEDLLEQPSLNAQQRHNLQSFVYLLRQTVENAHHATSEQSALSEVINPAIKENAFYCAA
ncbi:MAG TPA: response regulator [Allocoleopsis sp.]